MSWSSADEIIKLLALRDAHVLSDDEFEHEKLKVLATRPVRPQPESEAAPNEDPRNRARDWQYLYLAAELNRMLAAFEADYQDYQTPFRPLTGEPLTAPLESLPDLDVMTKSTHLITDLLQGPIVSHALGSGDETAIRLIADVFATAYSTMIDWARGVRHISLHHDIWPLLEGYYELPRQSIEDIRAFAARLSLEVANLVEARQQGQYPPKVTLNIKFSIDDEANRRIQEGLSVIQRNMMSTLSELAKVTGLHQAGKMNATEFESEKSRLLRRLDVGGD
jgi:hypothetical protein